MAEACGIEKLHPMDIRDTCIECGKEKPMVPCDHPNALVCEECEAVLKAEGKDPTVLAFTHRD